MDSQTSSTPASQQPYVRPSRIELEPAAFALAVVAVVMSISLWNPLPSAQQVAPVEHQPEVAQAPRG